MKVKKYPSYQPVIIGVVVLLLISWGLVDLLSNKPSIRAYCHETASHIKENIHYYNNIFTTTFEHAKQCGNGRDCLEEVSRDLASKLPPSFPALTFAPSTYFIRIRGFGDNSPAIEKMFLNGQYYYKTAETKGELTVANTALHRTICDQGWKIDGGASSMRYLYDLGSEAEIIIPVKFNGQTVGAIVRAWGD